MIYRVLRQRDDDCYLAACLAGCCPIETFKLSLVEFRTVVPNPADGQCLNLVENLLEQHNQFEFDVEFGLGVGKKSNKCSLLAPGRSLYAMGELGFDLVCDQRVRSRQLDAANLVTAAIHGKRLMVDALGF